ncbi:M23 family metallopeptidase [Parvularcula sp. ZS-1/3]|uniref:M23 family metallopeptidase n=1 Tax=Parvularcula mediterranea TaxID=2732508 RepID=A0A7Y3RJZ0_9PROT|nr:M23 family metallopeptidase [Parvularcula mediterranea]NNU15468.1 M23 family metallopeptidase [Parvularcula mediterranea]
MRDIVKFVRIAFLMLLFAGGWLLGDRFGVPQVVRDQTDIVWGQAVSGGQRAWANSEDIIRERLNEAAAFDFDVDLPELPSSISAEDISIVVTRPEVTPAINPSAPKTVAESGAMSLVRLCKGMSISNAPRAGSDLVVQGLAERRVINGVAIRTVPVSEGCISSGHGPRSGKTHRGVDFHHPSGSTVMAAASGKIVEAGYRDDFGNYVILDHGKGVYTRYAHLASFSSGIKAGRSVKDGQALGRMGNTAGYPMPIHLHYELLTGDYETSKKSFGLKDANPFTAGSSA